MRYLCLIIIALAAFPSFGQKTLLKLDVSGMDFTTSLTNATATNAIDQTEETISSQYTVSIGYARAINKHYWLGVDMGITNSTLHIQIAHFDPNGKIFSFDKSIQARSYSIAPYFLYHRFAGKYFYQTSWVVAAGYRPKTVSESTSANFYEQNSRAVIYEYHESASRLELAGLLKGGIGRKLFADLYLGIQLGVGIKGHHLLGNAYDHYQFTFGSTSTERKDEINYKRYWTFELISVPSVSLHYFLF